jgi:glutamyl-tRNA reductase
MLNGLRLWNFDSGVLPENVKPGTFVLSTCQRTLILSLDEFPFEKIALPPYELHKGQGAYYFLLETICGLKSKLIGENEIVGQFKEAYKVYTSSMTRDTSLLSILEKLFKDAKDIRTQYLIGISQKTYASLTRRHLIQKARASHVVILGSGALAEDLINQFKKKATVSICARNELRVNELAREHGLKVIPWDQHHELITEPFIANTIGHKDVLFDQTFFDTWSTINENRLFVDLGSPSVIHTNLSLSEGVVRLEDIFNEGAVVEEQKREQISLAREAMQSITEKRLSLFQAKLHRIPSARTPQFA